MGQFLLRLEIFLQSFFYLSENSLSGSYWKLIVPSATLLIVKPIDWDNTFRNWKIISSFRTFSLFELTRRNDSLYIWMNDKDSGDLLIIQLFHGVYSLVFGRSCNLSISIYISNLDLKYPIICQ